jgi:hypothetical protein
MKMDITNRIAEYRSTKTLLWNLLFRKRVDSFYSAVLSCFERIDHELFRALVVPNEQAFTLPLCLGSEPLSFIKIHGRWPGIRIQVRVGRTLENGNRVWESERIDFLSPEEVELDFIECFDWDPYGSPTFSLFRCRIVNSTVLPELVGHQCLVEASQVLVVLIGEEGAKTGENTAE